jgi:hypothetical protein
VLLSRACACRCCVGTAVRCGPLFGGTSRGAWWEYSCHLRQHLTQPSSCACVFSIAACLLQGDPSAAPYAVENAKAILGQKPVFGICMGHQLLGQAFGGKTFKLLFGHHGGNHPIRDVDTGKVQISAQNHNFAVDPATLPEGVKVSHINLNDGTMTTRIRMPARWMLVSATG